MRKIQLLLAAGETNTKDTIISYLKNQSDLQILIPPSFDNLFEASFLKSSLAIIDSSFSEHRGLEFLQILKFLNPSLPVVFLTSHGPEVALKAFKLGARDCFNEPFFTIDLIKSIEIILKATHRDTNEERLNILLDKCTNSLGPALVSPKKHPGIYRAQSFIKENFNRTFSLDLLARIACLSKFHFCRKFKKQVGMTCSVYLNQIRLKEAKFLLRKKEYSIKEICHRTGYNDISHFCRLFKKAEGFSPKKFSNNSK